LSTTIRRAEPLEVRRIAEVHVRAWQTAYRGFIPDELLDTLSVENREAMWRRTISGGDVPIWVAERAGHVIGFAATEPSRDLDAGLGVSELYAIYVEPEVVGTGVGRVLFARAVDHLWQGGYTAATLWVLEENTRARRFYEHAGWRPDGATKTERWRGVDLTEVRYRVERRES